MRIFIIIMLCASLLNAAPREISESLQKGIEQLDTAYAHWEKEKLEDAHALFEQAVRESGAGLALYWEGASLFYLSVYNLYSSNHKPDDAEGLRNIERGIEILTEAIQKNPDFSEPYALRGVLRGMKIKLKPWSALIQGPKVFNDRAKSLELNPDNPRVHFLTGVSYWHAPGILGGGDEAPAHFLKAEKLFEKENAEKEDNGMPRWGHSMCLAFIGDFYASLDDTAQARTYYNKSLKQNPYDPLAIKGLNNLNKKEKSNE